MNPDFFGTNMNPLETTGRPELLPAADDDDEDIDETLTERLIGLTEMFPDSVRKVGGSVFGFSFCMAKLGFTFGRGLLWVVASSATIMVLPIVFESEMGQQQQNSPMMVGPNAAMAGMPPGMAPPPPGMPPIPK